MKLVQLSFCKDICKANCSFILKINMKIIMKLTIVFMLFFALPVFSQVRKVKTKVRPINIKTQPIIVDKKALRFTFKHLILQKTYWYSYNNLGMNMSEVAFSNWNAGGTNSISFLANAKFRRRFAKTRYFWDNELLLNYGVNIQQEEKLKKTDDQIVLNSTFGYRTSHVSNWFYSAKMAFNSQFANGYKYPNKQEPISKFMAPGYLHIGIGAEFAPEKRDMMIFISPLTLKSTFVFDQKLADKGAFGVKSAEYDSSGRLLSRGKKHNSQVGFLVSGHWNTEVYQNITMNNRFSFYTEYNQKIGNIDVDWELSLTMKVNDYVQARLGTHIKYDDDVKFKEGIAPNGQKYFYGSAIQFKQILGIGISYKF